MPNPRKPFRFNVGFIIHEEVGYSHDFPFEFEKVILGDDLELRNFEGSVTVGKTPQGLLVQGKFSAETTVVCSRCLTDFVQGLDWEFTELYAFDQRSLTESGLILPGVPPAYFQALAFGAAVPRGEVAYHEAFNARG